MNEYDYQVSDLLKDKVLCSSCVCTRYWQSHVYVCISLGGSILQQHSPLSMSQSTVYALSVDVIKNRWVYFPFPHLYLCCVRVFECVSSCVIKGSSSVCVCRGCPPGLHAACFAVMIIYFLPLCTQTQSVPGPLPQSSVTVTFRRSRVQVTYPGNAAL